ncbi:hypothetical protein [Butyrivibrio sp. AC2005]|uniref:hypothetical protein n=1 Tax=Butyrivibrio sp. AC2005 TaxID=1280672 RepID=UPI0004297575|nr:hypothetical protein [Butyrivibrio sp. AC2005]
MFYRKCYFQRCIFILYDLTYQYYKKYVDAFNSNAYESKVLQFGGKSYKGIVLENVFIGMDQEINEVFAFDALKGDNKYFYYAITERLVSEQKYEYLSKEFGDNKFLDRDGIFVEYS